MKKALLVSESSVYRNENGELCSKGGAEVCFHNIARALKGMGIEPLVFSICEFEDQNEVEEIEGVSYCRFPVYSKSSMGIFRYLWTAMKKSSDFDFVFLNQFTPHLILPFLRKNKKICVVHDVYKGTEGFSWIGEYGFFKGGLGNVVERVQLFFDRKYADRIMTVSESSEQKLIGVLGEGVYGRLFKNPYPIDQGVYSKNIEKENFILFVGRFVDYKNPVHALYVLRKIRTRYPDYKAIFVVPRAEKKTMKNFDKVLSELNLQDQAIIKENLSDKELRDLYARAKLLIQPSFIEGQGIVLLEALASRTPVLAYDLPAYRGMAENGLNSILVKKGFVKGLEQGALDILNNHDFFSKNCGRTLNNFSNQIFFDVLKSICTF